MGDLISRQAAIDAIYKMHMNGKEGVLHDLKTETGSDAFFAETIADAVEALEDLPPVNPLSKDYNTIYYTPQPKTGHCVWCSSPYRIEYYWIDREGNTASYQDEDRHIVATGIAKYCPNCGARMIEPQESEE